MKKRLAQIFSLCIGLILCGALLSEILLYSENSLISNGKWISTKRTLQVGIMGSDEFLITRVPVAGNALNLGAWYGHQEVLLKEPGDFKEVSFRFKIPDNSYLDIILDKKNDAFGGVRLSRAAAYPSMYFSSDRGGRFLATQPIVLNELSQGWHKATMTFRASGLSLKIDRETPTEITLPLSHANSLGFRAGLLGAFVDDVYAIDASGATFHDSFRNASGWWQLWAIHFAALITVFAVAILLLLKVARWQESAVLNGSLVVTVQAILCLSLFHAFDLNYWSKLPFQMEMRMLLTGERIVQLPFEEQRHLFFKGWRNLVGRRRFLRQEILNQYPQKRITRGPIYCGPAGEECIEGWVYRLGNDQKHCKRIILVGTSQSVGSGARFLEESFFVRLHRGLARSFTKKCVESLNLSISGTNLAELTENFKKHMAFRPDVVILNLSNNDPGKEFYGRLRYFIKLTQQLPTKLIFLEEANSYDHALKVGLLANHQTLRRAGGESGIETFPLHDFLGSPEIRSSGQLWWDNVHLSSYGHELVAEWLRVKVLNLMEESGSVAKNLGPARR